MRLELFFTTVLPIISLYIFIEKIMWIDVNQMEDDVVKEHIAPENEKAKEMLDRLCQKTLWLSAQELYLKGILLEVKYLQENWDDPKNRDLLLKYLKEIDNICGFSKDKRDIKIESKLRSSKELFESASIS